MSIIEDYECQSGFINLSEEINISKIGTVLDAGANTVVIDPIDKTILKDNTHVLIISRESNKFDFLVKLSRHSRFKINSISERNSIRANLSSSKYYIFEMSRLKKHSFKMNYELDKVFYYNACNQRDSDIVKFIHVDSYMNELSGAFKLAILDHPNSGLQEIEKEVIEAVRESLEALQRTGSDRLFKLDLNKEQFASFNEKLICIDPVIYI